ncbi:hypothetical protein N802_01035 [Knoellia sinensis KCTC 19936]|uniref:DUF8094 domain-containing protein n=1 Tax=Knoellia sinensis KCTC 19936 TaxID=1385520 RepID=A0A0A0JCC5_9MICO|nr:hypothetical protein [Knoellia sinensis]KGN35000.1 hypothetical protein N802_01035 [Knoellia sinensis KCTC 19936]
MKRLLAILLALMGLLCAAVGIAGTVLIGTDDVVNSPTTTLKLGGAKAVVSTPGLLALKDATLQVSATHDGGPVFVGRAHPIDATSYLDGVSTYAVTSVGTSGMSGKVVDGDSKVIPADPTKQTFWKDMASGPGTQRLSLDLDGSATAYVIVPMGRSGAVSVTSGLVIPYGFMLSIAAIVLGALGIVGAWLLQRRGSGPETPQQNSDEPPVASSAEADSSDSAVDAEERALEPTRAMTRRATALALTALLPVLAGCGMVPSKVEPWRSDSITKPAMTHDEAVAAMKDYDVRNNTAIKASATSYDPVAWAKADTGIVFAQDRIATTIQKLHKDKDSTPLTHTVKGLYAPTFATYPMYSIVNVDRAADGKTSHSIAAFTRQSAVSPWLMAANASYTHADLPKPLAAGVASHLTDPEKEKLVARIGDLTKQLNAGKGSLVTGELSTIVEDFMGFGGKPAAFRLWSSEADQFGPRGSIQAVKVAGDATLAVVSLQADTVHDAGKGNVWKASALDNDYLRATGQTTKAQMLRVRNGVTVVLLVDRKGGVKPLAVSADGVPL